MPGRYAKPEASNGFLSAIDSYIYRTPASQMPPPAADGVAATPNEPDRTTAQAPTAEDDGVTHANPQ